MIPGVAQPRPLEAKAGAGPRVAAGSFRPPDRGG